MHLHANIASCQACNIDQRCSRGAEHLISWRGQTCMIYVSFCCRKTATRQAGDLVTTSVAPAHLSQSHPYPDQTIQSAEHNTLHYRKILAGNNPFASTASPSMVRRQRPGDAGAALRQMRQKLLSGLSKPRNSPSEAAKAPPVFTAKVMREPVNLQLGSMVHTEPHHNLPTPELPGHVSTATASVLRAPAASSRLRSIVARSMAGAASGTIEQATPPAACGGNTAAVSSRDCAPVPTCTADHCASDGDRSCAQREHVRSAHIGTSASRSPDAALDQVPGIVGSTHNASVKELECKGVGISGGCR